MIVLRFIPHLYFLHKVGPGYLQVAFQHIYS